MTRKRMVQSIKDMMEERGLSCDKDIADAAADAALNYVLSYAQEVSQELVGAGLYSEAMIAGMFTNKIKMLRSEHYE